MKSLKIAVIVLTVAVVTLATLLWITNNRAEVACCKEAHATECCEAAGHGDKSCDKKTCDKHANKTCDGMECENKGEAKCGGHGGCEKHNACRVNEPALENIMTRTSIRAFTGETVSDEVITRIVKAGMAAPTAVNKQPWAFVVIKDRALLEKLGGDMRNASMTKTAAFAIVVCGDMNKTLQGKAKDFWIQDVSAASQNILLAAHAFGLGAVWTGLYPDTDRAGKVASMLSLPSNLMPLNLIPIGYPAENPAPKDKWKPENVITK